LPRLLDDIRGPLRVDDILGPPNERAPLPAPPRASTLVFDERFTQVDRDRAFETLAGLLLPPAFVLLFGLGVAWAAAGFRSRSP
jgi:hypothetical protein